MSVVMDAKEEMELLSLVAQRTINAVIITDRSNKISWINEGFSKMTGYTWSEAIGRSSLEMLQGKDTDPERIGYMTKKIKNGRAFECEILYYRKDGTPFWMHMQAHPVHDESGEALRYFGLGTDISEQRKLRSELAKQKKSTQREISRAILKAQENERGRIGRELHDNVNQLLVSVNLYLYNMGNEQVFKKDLLNTCSKYIDDAINEIRSLTRIFGSPISKNTSLKESLEDLRLSLSYVSRVNITLVIDQFDEQGITQECKQNIYRIVQEQLNNAIKYAEATTVEIRIITNPKGVELIISDDGKGFDIKTCRKGLGLINIRHRAESFNGKVDIISAEGMGCIIHVVMPLETCAA